MDEVPERPDQFMLMTCVWKFLEDEMVGALGFEPRNGGIKIR